MSAETAARCIDELEEYLDLDLSRLRPELEDTLLPILRDHPDADDEEPGWELQNDLRRTLLQAISGMPALALQADRILDHFRSQVEDDQRDMVSPDQEPLSDEAVSALHEISALWNMLPRNLVRQNQDLVRKAAARFHRPDGDGPRFDDLVSVGNEALFRAALNKVKNPEKDFRKLAWQVLREKMKGEQGRHHPVPHRTRQKLVELAEKRETLGLHSNQEDELIHLAGEMGLSDGEMQSLVEVEAIWGQGLEIDASVLPEELEIADPSPGALDLLISRETSLIMGQAMTTLSGMQRRVIEQIYFKDASLREAAQKLDVSLNVVRKNHRKAVRKLKNIIDEE